MHGFEDGPLTPAPAASGPWYREMNRYHWFVLAVAAMGWLFDTMDQQLFVLARPAAMEELFPRAQDADAKTLEALRQRAAWRAGWQRRSSSPVGRRAG